MGKDRLTKRAHSYLLDYMKTEIDKKEKKQGITEKKKPVSKGQLVECTISSMNHEGYGTGIVDGFPVLVRGAFPNELVRVRITFVGRREAFAEVVKVLRKSPVRMVKPSCDKVAACEGCPFVRMQYKAQLEWKKQMVADAVHDYKSLADTIVHPVIPSAKSLGYRNSAKLVVAGKFAEPIIGIYRHNTHEVVDISDCPLHHPLINRVVKAVKEGIGKGKVPIYSQRSGSGIIRYLVIRVSEDSGKAMVAFVTAHRSFNEIHHLAKYLQSQVPEVSVVVQNVNSSTGNVIMGQQDYFVTREQALNDRIGDIRFLISPRSFFQINNGAARAIYEKVAEWSDLSGSETVVDVYCGVGGISLFLAGRAKEVIGYETVDEAVLDAEKNARLNGVRNCRFEAGDASELLEGLHEDAGTVDLVVLNPPRKGCDESVLKKVALLGPAKVIYVSCSPQTLARDLDMLADYGYKSLEIQPVDMFPQTPHIENVALLKRSR
jgi:23S rRNA (uracil1939-C5)-methyltransferase